MAKATSTASKAGLPFKGIKIIASGKYPLVPLDAITVVSRPKAGEDKIFYNARDPEEIIFDKIESLILDIRAEGLHQPPIVRAVTTKKAVTAVELIAGERRITSLRYIAQHDLPCLDDASPRPKLYAKGQVVVCNSRFGQVQSQEGKVVTILFDDKTSKACNYDEVYPTMSGRKLYQHVPCKVFYDCSDERAVRLNFKENHESEGLSIKDEIALVRRFAGRGRTQAEISELLGTNITWVSQTFNFESQLPQEAFDKLLGGHMTRHVAVNILSYAADDRQRLYDEAVLVEAKKSADRIRKLKGDQALAEDLADCFLVDAKKADEAGKPKLADKLRKKANSATKKAQKAKARLSRAKQEQGHLSQGDIRDAAAKAGLKTRKTKSLEKDQIASLYDEGLGKFLKGDLVDPVTGNKVPHEFVSLVQLTAQAIVAGEHDPLQPIREHMYETGDWERPDDEPPTSGKKKGSRQLQPEDFDALSEDDGYDDDSFDDESNYSERLAAGSAHSEWD